jgi:hypothetical protein
MRIAAPGTLPSMRFGGDNLTGVDGGYSTLADLVVGCDSIESGGKDGQISGQPTLYRR